MRSSLIVVALLGLACGARAGTSAETRFFDDLARRQYEKGNYSEALRAFLRTDRITPSAASLYNIAICAELAHQPGLAFAAYEEYLRADDHDAERRRDAEHRLAAFLPGLAVVTIESDPPGATIRVDRAELGSFGETPRRVALEPGEHRVTLELDGFLARSTSVILVRGKSVEITEKLSPELGTLTLDVEPRDAVVDVVRMRDRFALTASGSTLMLPVGGYHVHVHAPKHSPADADVVVSKNAESRATLVARPLPQPTGRLLVAAGEEGTEVFVDGRRRAAAPAALSGLSVGVHSVELRAKARVVYRAEVKIREGRTTLLEPPIERKGKP